MASYGELVGRDDIVGMDEILGDDDLIAQCMGMDDGEILGAALRARTPSAKRFLKNVLAMKRASASTAVVKRQYTDSGIEPIGFVGLNIAAGASATITTQPQKLFKPKRLVVPPSIGPFFTIDNILVGNKSQFPSAVPVPAEGFAPDSWDTELILDTVQPAINLSLVVTNISGGQQNFRAMITGKTVD